MDASCYTVTAVTVTIVTGIMKFYDRKQELEQLERLDTQANQSGIMTVLTGRRRVGKTMLALHFSENKRFLYLFVGRKEEGLLCQEFLEEIIKLFDVPIIGKITTFKEIFSLLLEIAKKERFTLIIDEFQEFFQINPAVYSDIQKLWDLNKHSIKLHIIFIGSVYSLMHKIFEDSKQPLFGRANRILQIKPFSINALASILKENKAFTVENLFYCYVLTGCMPKYIDIFLSEQAYKINDMLECVLQKDSLFLNEGKNLLIEEFGRDYLTYFTILELISLGKTSRGEIESLLGKDVGGYLQRLEQDYAVIIRHRSIHNKIHVRNQKYKILDNFLNFWFRFLYKNRTAIEMENFSYIAKLIKRDFSTYCGPLLERFFHKLLAETGLYNEIGSYWEKNNQNEIDVVATNDLEKIILIAETKMGKAEVSLKELAVRASSLLSYYQGYSASYEVLRIQDAEKFLQTS